MSDAKHISISDFYAFQHDLMYETEKENFLEHISNCDHCSDQFAAMMSEHLIEAPRDMKANILKATKSPEVQFVIKVKQTSKQVQLFWYSLKVGTATVLALLLLIFTFNFTGPLSPSDPIRKAPTDITIENNDYVPITKVIRSRLDNLSSNMFDFPNKIMNSEVLNND